MKKTKRIISILLTAVMLLGLLPAGIVSVSAATGAIDPSEVTDWYTTEAQNKAKAWKDGDAQIEVTIDTAAELLSFANYISQSSKDTTQTNNFWKALRGVTVKLGCDIDLNEGWSAAEFYAGNASVPANKWDAGTKTFHGIFDGNGHTISGIYCKNKASAFVGCLQQVYGSIRNLAIVNSYFENTETDKTDYGAAAFVAGNNGAIEAKDQDSSTAYNGKWLYNLYTDAIIVSNGDHAGGIVGNMQWGGDHRIDSCVFAGIVDAENETGAGGIAGSTKSSWFKLKNCVNMGTIKANNKAGGLVGGSWENTSIALENCVNLGTVITTNGTLAGNIGAYMNTGSKNFEMTNCYWVGGAKGTDGVVNSAVPAKNETEGHYGGSTGTATQVNLADVAKTLAEDTAFTAETWANVTGSTIMLPKYIVDTFSTELASAIADLYKIDIYVQKNTDGTKLRFVGVVRVPVELSEYSKLGFAISMNYNNAEYNKTVDTQVVYTDITVDDALVNASAYGGDYFFIIEIAGMDNATASDAVFNVTATMTSAGAATDVTNSASYTFDAYVAP